jgi:DNA-directed RNA polymerase specialized sigma24 family protein
MYITFSDYLESYNFMIVYSRYKDGSIPVNIVEPFKKYEIYFPDKTITCASTRQVLRAFNKDPNHWSFNRYFKISKEARISFSDIFTLFTPSPQKGIDLSKREKEVAKLLYAGFKSWILSCGYDFEEVLQEVYKGILIRNNGICPFDESKSSFGHYVYQICHCILSNYHKKESKHLHMEQLGAYDADDEETDAADTFKEPLVVSDNLLLFDIKNILHNPLQKKILYLLHEGYNQNEIAVKCNLSKSSVIKTIGDIRTLTSNQGYKI